MSKPYTGEFRARVVALVRAGKAASDVAADLGISASCLQNSLRQERIDRGEIDCLSRAEGIELRRARTRIRELEREVEILRVASMLLGEDAPHPMCPCSETRLSHRSAHPMSSLLTTAQDRSAAEDARRHR